MAERIMPQRAAASLRIDAISSEFFAGEGLLDSAETYSATDAGIPYIVDEFWTAKQRQCHSIHEISYRACFKPQLPEFFIKRLTQPGDVVLDPFLGRGTTAIQAALMGRKAYGSDINPLSAYLTRPRLNTPTIEQIHSRLLEIPMTADIPEADVRLLVFYHRKTLSGLIALKNWFVARDKSNQLDHVDDWIRMVALNRLTGHSTGFFSVRTMPPNQAVSVEAQAKINERLGQQPEEKDLAKLIIRKSKSLLRDGGLEDKLGSSVHCASADALSYLDDSSVSLIVTSPPFLNIVNYKNDNWLRCWFAGVKAGALEVADHSSISGWKSFIGASFKEFARVLKPGAHVAFEVGEARNGTVKLEEQVIEAIVELPFSLRAVLVNDQAFTKTANCWGVQNNAKGTNTNRIVLCRRQ